MKVAGLPQVARHARLAARQGWARAVVLVDDATRPEVERALRLRPPPPGFAVELASAEPEGGSWVRLDARAVYDGPALQAAARSGAPPSPIAVLASARDARDAERRLYRALRKSVDLDGAVAYYAMRPISRQITRLLIDTPVTPNQVTIAVLLSGVLGGWLAGRGGDLMGAIAGLVYWFGTVVDCVDGELARLRLAGSKIGEWLDTIADDVTTYGLLAGLGVGLWRDGAGDAWLWIGVAGAVGGVLVKAFLYWDLHRMRLPIDTAAYPWWFGAPQDASKRGGGLLSRLWYYLEFLFRRDGYCTMVAIALLLGAREVATAGLAIGGLLPAPVLAVHYAITSARRRA